MMMSWAKAHERVKSWLLPLLEFVEALLDLIITIDLFD